MLSTQFLKIGMVAIQTKLMKKLNTKGKLEILYRL